MSAPDIFTLDVRPDFRSGKSPCDKIQKALARVSRDETLRLLVPFEPIPLYEVATAKGLSHRTTKSPDGDWEVLFIQALVPTSTTAATAAADATCGCGCTASELPETVEVDARGLEPPQPMIKILEALAALPGDGALRARTDRRPIHLYPMLHARGFAGASEEQSDGSFITHIRRV